MRRETSRVSVLVCPFCVRDLLSVLKTSNGGTWMRVISTLNLKTCPGKFVSGGRSARALPRGTPRGSGSRRIKRPSSSS